MSQHERGEHVLPPVPDDEQVLRMERTVLAEIADDARRRRARRGRVWAGAGAAAAVVVLAALIGPVVAGPGGSSGSVVRGVSLGGGAAEPAQVVQGSAADGVELGRATTGDAGTGREIVASGAVTLAVDDPTAMVAPLSTIVTELGGYVESSTTDTGPTAAGSRPANASLQARVPADALQALLDRLATLGDVTSSQVTRADVTDQAADLRARRDAAQTSVTRLTQLMSQAGSVADLLTAEKALAERQAELESLEQQLAALEGQVAMSTLSVTLTARAPAVEPEPGGFLDGLATGWHGFLVTVNGVVVGLGFLLPWILLAGLVAGVVWGVRRLRRRRGRNATQPGRDAP
ncbi:DUF4349 domain-containing protein [Microbacterium sp. SORGH_AS_0888]|uniref:DUF4349 domain-containing protein n=1 Tax=Microbacterium sp. SORGH_AS_0888 TaxID=3041791 RepID=UPI00277E9473|nr:DUF4349 domain-containing protein [Microbacterium sp. SORGH_AS_0888]MDQ1128365.1 polyhydroxyalkanoate synthesis regulator phasin [Microbacterium sp. SORGH_AS_0888]